jgi:hypothetical protein
MAKSAAIYAGLENMNCLLMLAGLIGFIEICQVRQLSVQNTLAYKQFMALAG